MEILPKKIKYRKGYKYQLAETYSVYVDIRPEKDIITEYVKLYRNGLLVIKRSYACDGPSGPTIDTPTNMRGAFIHDALCQLLRLGSIPQSCKEAVHRELQKIMIEDGAFKIRAWYFYKAVSSRFGDKSCSPGYEPYPVLTAP